MSQDFRLNKAIKVVNTIYEEFGVKGFFRGCTFRCGILSFGGIVYFGTLQKARIMLDLNNDVSNSF